MDPRLKPPVVLDRTGRQAGLPTQLGRRTPGPVRVLEQLAAEQHQIRLGLGDDRIGQIPDRGGGCLLYTSDAADE